jgi:hypothetical protein
MLEQLNVADMIEMRAGQEEPYDLGRRNPHVREPASNGSGHDAPDIMRDDPAAGFLGDGVFDARPT